MTNNNDLLTKFASEATPEIKKFVDKNLEISDYISELLEAKGLSQKDLAEKTGKNQSEISKWISGLHNLTLKSIIKMELAIGEEIITTPKSRYNIIQFPHTPKDETVLEMVWNSKQENTYETAAS
jgi:transcriptional regulator with XRE-family HTH domain